MNFIAHRGCWKTNEDKNTIAAIRESMECGYGFESDIRDFDGRIVISHDMANSFSPDAKEVFRMMREFGDRYYFAINIKADGLAGILEKHMTEYRITKYFCFDMSVPQMLEYKATGLNFLTRQSELERNPCLYDDAYGVWIDAFWSTNWITESLLREHLDNHKIICVVSPELHGNLNYKGFWAQLKKFDIDLNLVFLCTDYPGQAKEFFYE